MSFSSKTIVNVAIDFDPIDFFRLDKYTIILQLDKTIVCILLKLIILRVIWQIFIWKMYLW